MVFTKLFVEGESMANSNSGTKGVPRSVREKQIIDVAIRHFGTNKYADTLVIDVANEINVSKTLIFSYFESKEGLFKACLAHAGNALIHEATKISSISDFENQFRPLATLEQMFMSLEGREHFWPMFFDQTAPPESKKMMSEYRHVINEAAETGVRRLLTHFGLDDDLNVSVLTEVWIAVSSALITWWNRHPEISAKEMSDRVNRIALTFLGDQDRTKQDP